MSEAPSSVADRIVEMLTPDLGPHTASQALRVVCKRTEKTPETLGPEDLEVALDVLRRMLRTLLGQERTGRLLDRLASEVTR